MQYTLWSRGRLLGATDLGFVVREDGFRCGWFHSSELGERRMPAATGVSPALRAAWAIGPDATARADVLAAVDEEEALELELRQSDGAVVATESIAIIDTHYLRSIPENDVPRKNPPPELDPEEEAAIEAEIEEWLAEREAEEVWRQSEEETEFPRYQIQVRLVDHDSIP